MKNSIIRVVTYFISLIVIGNLGKIDPILEEDTHIGFFVGFTMGSREGINFLFLAAIIVNIINICINKNSRYILFDFLIFGCTFVFFPISSISFSGAGIVIISSYILMSRSIKE